MPKLIIFAILLSAQLANAYPSLITRPQCTEIFRIKPHTISESFQDLAFSNELISQTDPALGKRNLLIEHGGLCASTCAVNSLHALYRYMRLDTSNFESYNRVNELVTLARKYLSEDAREGMQLQELGYVLGMMNGRMAELNLSIKRIPQITEWNVSPPEGAIHIVGVEYDGDNSLHALIILEMNQFDRTVVYSDPYHPERIVSTTYREYIEDGKTKFQIFMDNHKHPDKGVIVDQLRIQILGHLPPH